MRRRGQRGGREEADREVQRRLSGEEKAAAETIWRICGGGGGGGGEDCIISSLSKNKGEE